MQVNYATPGRPRPYWSWTAALQH